MALGKRVRTVSCIFLSSILLLALFPFYVVLADSATYSEINGSYLYSYSIGAYSYTKCIKTNNNVRATVIREGGQYNFYLYFISLSPFKYTSNNNSCPSYDANVNAVAQSYNGNSFYGEYISLGNAINSSIQISSDIPCYYLPNGESTSTMMQYAYRLTFGDMSVDPAPPATSYGNLIIEGYSTDIAGQGEASINNIDHIKWNGYVDSNGIDITNCKVRLQIIPGQYTGNSKNDLTNKTRQDFVLNPINASDSLFNANIGEVTLSWRDIVNRIDIIPYRLYSLELLGPDWQKDGWIYKLRLEDEENDYIGEWQTVYSSTSNGVQNDLNITNITTINQTLVQTFQELNSINNVENSWIYNNTEISVENNYTEPQSGDKPWWAYLLESILNTFNITNNYINNGNEGTQTIVDTVNDSDDDLNDKLIDYHTYEDDFINDMEDNLSDIDVETDLFEDNKFIASANWVAQQYTRMTNNNVIGSLIGFSLLLGLALIFIGKIR